MNPDRQQTIDQLIALRDQARDEANAYQEAINALKGKKRDRKAPRKPGQLASEIEAVLRASPEREFLGTEIAAEVDAAPTQVVKTLEEMNHDNGPARNVTPGKSKYRRYTYRPATVVPGEGIR